MTTIWRFPFEITDSFTISMPGHAQVLDVQLQRGQPTLWALVDQGAELRERRFAIHGTGRPIEGWPGKFVGTFQMLEGALVWHLFEV